MLCVAPWIDGVYAGGQLWASAGVLCNVSAYKISNGFM